MPLPSLYRAADANALRARLGTLTPRTPAQWGKMDVAQMLAHCQVPLQSALGDVTLRRTLVGRLFGRLAKKSLVGEKPFGRNLPTDRRFRVTDARDFDAERGRLMALLDRLVGGGPSALSKDPHPFFGPLTPAEWDALLWKHLDHHLRQFGA